METTQASILFVDDEEVIRTTFVRDLVEEGFTVTQAGSGREALDLLAGKEFDLVLTDLMMPEVDGFAVIKGAASLQQAASVIVLTGYGDMNSAIDALRLGADDFLLKPCEIEELLFRIRRVLDKRNLLRRLAERNRDLEAEMARRKEAEELLVESEQRCRLALDASSNGVWDRNLLTGEVYFGENWRRTFGHDDSAGTMANAEWEKLLHPDDRHTVLSLREAHVQGITNRYEAEFRMKNRHGGWRWILSRGQVVAKDADGRATRIVGTHTDITRLKQMEEDLRLAGMKLEHRVNERTAELSETNTALTVLLKKREQDKAILEEQVLANVSKLVEPFLAKLEESRLSDQQRVLVGILRSNISELTSPFAANLSSKMTRLTPAELQVASLVKQGKRTKEIAEILHLSPGTINIHRKNIRKKLGLTHQNANLQSVLALQS